MTVRCPSCQAEFHVQDGRVPAGGARTTCPGCGQKFDIAARDRGGSTALPGPHDDLFELPPAELAAVTEDDLFAVHGAAASPAGETAANTPPAAAPRRGLWAWLGGLFGRR